LDGKEWIKRTKSVWFSEAPKRDPLKVQHPATFSEKDIKKLIEFFTKPKEVVLDPFLGSGTVAVVCRDTGRRCIGIELYQEWLNMAKERVGIFNSDIRLIQGDAIEELRKLEEECVDYIITSPPYWGILKKIDHKAKRERLSKNLAINYGQHEKDLSLIESYDDFLNAIEKHFAEYYRVLKRGRYVSIVVSDFRHKDRYYMFHSDAGSRLERVSFLLQGLIILVQDNKHLYPYGYPTTFVPNINHQFILIARKP
ncbi:MAG: DNA methyltransferase, partial [Aquificaceae bacterium]|nr:site-specific DNA-methyltransferase [Aquificaceae bacterium]MDW8237917.1 DNA methyltransferase [Aquificaceae bacterium]